MACLARFLRFKPVQTSITSIYIQQLRFLTIKNTPLVTQIPIIPIKLTDNSWIYRENNKIEQPFNNKLQIELPNHLIWRPPLEDPFLTHVPLEMPSIEREPSAIEAARLIVIRRNKMRRHKLKKLRIRMKYEWAKRRQRRELKKEKDFQAALIKQCKEGEAFSAENYVSERLKKLKQVSVEVKYEKMSVAVKRM